MAYTLLIKSLSFLAGILALIYLCFHLYKKKSSLFVPAHQRINVLEKRAIDPRVTISLVRIDDRELIVVSHQNGVAVHGVPETILTKTFKDLISASKNAVQ